MTIEIICVGKIKEKYFREAVEEYSKRLSRYCRIRITQVDDEPVPDNASAKEEEQIRQREGDRIRKAVREGSYCIALAIDGETYDSVGFSRHIDRLCISGESDLTFIIGGSIGLSAQVVKMCRERLSFSALTFPHQLMRVILLEQIYRAFRISRGEPYHK